MLLLLLLFAGLVTFMGGGWKVGGSGKITDAVASAAQRVHNAATKVGVSPGMLHLLLVWREGEEGSASDCAASNPVLGAQGSRTVQ